MKTIRQLREERGVSQGELGGAVGIKPITVYKWERSDHEPKASQLRVLARIFGVSMDDIDFPVPMPGKVAA